MVAQANGWSLPPFPLRGDPRPRGRDPGGPQEISEGVEISFLPLHPSPSGRNRFRRDKPFRGSHNGLTFLDGPRPERPAPSLREGSSTTSRDEDRGYPRPCQMLLL